MRCKQSGRGCACSTEIGFASRSPENDFALLHNAGGPGFEAIFAIAG